MKTDQDQFDVLRKIKKTPDASQRELAEELGINTSSSCLAPLNFASHAYTKEDSDSVFHLLLMLYACRRWQGRPQPIEGGELKWVRPNRLREYPMPAADTPLIAAVQDLL